jgi:hypothetical protein
MRLYEVETNRTNKGTNKPTANTKTDFEQNVSKLNAKRRSLDAEKAVKPLKPS